MWTCKGTSENKYWLYCKSKRKENAILHEYFQRGSFQNAKEWRKVTSFRNRFTTERSRRYDVLQSKEVIFLSADGCSKRASEFSKPGYHLKPSDGRRLNLFIKEHRSMFDKLNGMVKHLKEHESTLFQPNGLTLKQGEEFTHDFNVEQIKCIEAKLLKVKQDMEMLEENKKSFHTISLYIRAYIKNI